MSLFLEEKTRDARWPKEITNEAKKVAIAKKLCSNLSAGDVVGVGSGSTSFVTLVELAKKAQDEGLDISVVGTSIEIERAAMSMGVRVVSLGQGSISWSFDGADEVDPNGRLIKGRGGAMFREKLLMASSAKRFIVVDSSKFVSKLGEKFAVPVEVVPAAVDLVRSLLEPLGAVSAPLRAAGGKDGPVLTEQGGVILDVSFADEVPSETTLESIPGVIATGLFENWPYETVSDSEK